MKKLLPLVFAMVVLNTNAQQNSDTQKDWRELMQDPNANFYDVQKAANAYWDTHDKNESGNGYKPYKRWEAFMEPRVFPSGKLYLPSTTWDNYQAFLNENTAGNKGTPNMLASITWTAMGPFGAMTSSACGLPRKAGRDNFITFHPSITGTYWCGAPAGGLWKTTNNGTTWSTTTDNLSVIGCSDLAVDPITPATMYMATGDGDAGDTYAIGVLKSIDGGATWNPTGLTWAVNLQRLIRRLVINPVNPQIVIAATNAGVWRTTNGGATWASVSGINAYDVELKPGNPNVVYIASATAFYRSTNAGATFALVASGIPTSGYNRYNIAVTTADTNYVYVLAAAASNGFGGMFRSTVGGTLFTTMSTTPDVLANSCTGAAGSGQGWYDLACAVSPLNRDEVVVGGVNHWRSMNGGASWTNIGCWNATGANPPYIHADVHELEYTTAGVLYSCNDGGVYQHTGTAWTDRTSPRNIAQQYRIGLSGTTANYWITGHQDNGSNIFNGTTYDARYCGDGMDCFIDRTNNNNVFCSTPNGNYLRSTNGGLAWSAATTGLTGGTYWVSPWKQDPIAATTLYSSRNNLFKSTNLGVSWAQAGTIPGSGSQGVVEFAIAPSNNDVIYVIHGSTGVYKTTNATSATPTWANTGALPATAAKEWVCVDPTDPNTAWVTYSGYVAGTKVYQTTNGGTTWTNVSSNLPNLPANCIVYEPGSNDRVYVGMDVGVYYKDNSTANWTLYNAGLPNAPISDLEMSPANPGKIFASTYGRGVFKVDVVAAAAPITNFSFSPTGLCAGSNVVFTDMSISAPTAWSWTVSPMTGVTVNTSASQNPTVNFTNPGTYTVSAIASNTIGLGTVATQTITISSIPVVNVTVASQTVCLGAAVTYTASGASAYSWTSGGGTGVTATYFPTVPTTYTVTGTTLGCVGTKTAAVAINPLPTINAATTSSNLCVGQSAIVNATGGTSYTWAPGGQTGASVTFTPATTTNYTASGTGSNGCIGTGVVTISVSTCISVQQIVNSGAFSVYPNPTSGQLNIKLAVNKSTSVSVEVVDLNGKVVLKQNLNFSTADGNQNINISSLAAGSYFLKLNTDGKTETIRIIKD